MNEETAQPPDPTTASSALVMLAAAQCRFFRSPRGTLRLTVNDHVSYPHVHLRRLFPIRYPERYIQVSAGAGREIGILQELGRLDKDSRRHLEDELDFYYAVPQLRRIDSIAFEYGFSFWETQTDRGPRCFYVKGRTESIKAMSDARVFVTDIDNCRYEIADLEALPRASRDELDKVL